MLRHYAKKKKENRKRPKRKESKKASKKTVMLENRVASITPEGRAKAEATKRKKAVAGALLLAKQGRSRRASVDYSGAAEGFYCCCISYMYLRCFIGLSVKSAVSRRKREARVFPKDKEKMKGKKNHQVWFKSLTRVQRSQFRQWILDNSMREDQPNLTRMDVAVEINRSFELDFTVKEK